MLLSRKMRFSNNVMGAALLGAFTLGAAPAIAATFDEPQISVTGQGKAEAAPDMATITLGVTSEAEEAAAAMAETSSRVAEVLERLREAGIEARDLQTSGLNMQPRWHYPDGSDGSEPRITGFIATNMVTVRVRDLESLGPVLDDVIQGGANTLHGLTFGMQEPQPVEDDARRDAVADAQRKAELLAEAAGVTLGPILSITEDGYFEPPRPAMRMEAAMGDSSVPVAEGELSMEASVTIIYSIAE